MLGQLFATYGAKRVVPIAFHVDYFNDPWKDPFSRKRFSQRQYQYSLIFDKLNKLKNKNYLYFTPMMMFDGRVPMLGSDDADRKHSAKPVAIDHIEKLLAEPARAALELKLDAGPSRKKRLAVTATPRSAELAGRRLLVEAVVWQDPVSTNVASGELAGKTYSGRFAARSLVSKPARIASRGRTPEFSFDLELEADDDPARFGVAVLLQDEANGRVYQAASTRWDRPMAE